MHVISALCNKTNTEGRSHSQGADRGGTRGKWKTGRKEKKRKTQRPERVSQRGAGGGKTGRGGEGEERRAEDPCWDVHAPDWSLHTCSYTWAPLWALRAHYRKTEQNTETITHRHTETRSSKNLKLSFNSTAVSANVEKKIKQTKKKHSRTNVNSSAAPHDQVLIHENRQRSKAFFFYVRVRFLKKNSDQFKQIYLLHKHYSLVIIKRKK